MPTIKELKKHLETYKEDDVIAYDIWQVADVRLQAKLHNLELTDEECEEILEKMDHNKDANYGLSWDVMDVYLEDLVAEKCIK